MSEIAETPEVAEEQSAEIETGNEEEQTEAVESEGSSESVADDASGESEPKKHNPVQPRINELTRRAREAEERAREAEQRAKALESQIQQTEEAPYPKLSDFDYDEERYNQALSQYHNQSTQKNIQGAMAQQERMQAQLAQRAAQQAVMETFKARSDAFAAEHTDYLETITNPNVPVNQTMTQALVFADNGPAVAYHLGKNPQVAAEIAALPAPQALMRMGQLSAQLSTPVTPKPTSAPAPAKPPTGSSSGKAEKDPDKMTPTEYAKWRGYIK